jgi:nitroreductase
MSVDDPSNDRHSIDDLIRARRTNMFVDRERPLSDDVIHELCELATWAPNHKRNWPWRFASVTGAGRSRLGRVVSNAMAAHGDDPNKVTKALTKYERTPNILIIGSTVGDTDERTAENRDAVAAAAQNLMLAATARGIATYWGSCPRGSHEAVADFAGFDPGTHIVGIFYMGHQSATMEVPVRPDPVINVIDD